MQEKTDQRRVRSQNFQILGRAFTWVEGQLSHYEEAQAPQHHQIRSSLYRSKEAFRMACYGVSESFFTF